MKLIFSLKTMIFYKRVTIFTLALSLIVAPVTLARYIPPRNQKPPSDYSKTAGTRGCPDFPGFTILAPKTHVGESSSTQPTVAWFIFNTSEESPTLASEVELTLYEFNSENRPQRIGQPISLKISPGIMKQSLSEIKLAKDKIYLWQIVARCPNGEVIQRAEFSVVEMPPSLEKAISTQADSAKKMDLYAEAGFWYDALGQALTLAKNGKLGQAGSNLLEDLAEAEEAKAPISLTDPECEIMAECKEIKERVRRLKQIAISER
jgi:hypothetical protein